MLILACPGQGAQSPGFLSPWLEIPSFATTLGELSEACGIDLVKHGTMSDADTIRDTAIAQPLIVAASIATGLELGANFDGVAGHSVGEVAAATLAGIFTPKQGMEFVAVRSKAMAAAAAETSTSMAAVLGGDESNVIAKLTSLELEPANYNGAGQIVAAGASDKIAQLVAEGIEGSRVVPLQVAGAFHTRFMQPAVAQLEAHANSLEVSNPEKTIWTNKDGSTVASGSDYVSLMVGQVASSVRWDLCMSNFAGKVTAMIELCPAGTLTGLAKRALPGVELLALKTPDQLDAAKALMEGNK